MDANLPPEKKFGYLCLSSGQKLDLHEPQAELMDITVIAKAISKLCRFSGQINHFYSVAQHSVFVSQIVPEQYALEGLLHDATEAFVADVPKPIKHLLTGYAELEERIWDALCERYSFLSAEISEVVHIADRIAVITEARDMMNNDDWTTWYPGLEPAPARIIPMTPLQAEQAFLNRYFELVETHELSRTA